MLPGDVESNLLGNTRSRAGTHVGRVSFTALTLGSLRRRHSGGHPPPVHCARNHGRVEGEVVSYGRGEENTTVAFLAYCSSRSNAHADAGSPAPGRGDAATKAVLILR